MHPVVLQCLGDLRMGLCLMSIEVGVLVSLHITSVSSEEGKGGQTLFHDL